MTQLTEIVRNEIQTSPSIKADLQKKIINIRALAKYIKKKYSLGFSLDAIISALRRVQESYEGASHYEEPSNLVVGSTLSSKNQVSSVLLEKNEEVLKALPRIFEKVEMAQHSVLRIVHAKKSVKIFVDQSLLEQVLSLFSKKSIKVIERNLGEIIIDLNEKSWRKLGILSLLTSELYLNKINILDCLTCVPEIVFVFKEDELTKAYEVFYTISKGNAKG